MNPDAISRLKSQLITSGLQTKDNALFQVVNQLINAVTDATVLALATDATVGTIVSGINQLTGDVLAGPGTGNQVATLAATAVAAGSYGDATHVATFTVDSKGRLTAASTVLITFPAAGITQLTGDGTAGPGSGSQAFTLAVSGVTAGTYGDATHVPQITVDAKGRATAITSVLITDTGITQLTGDVTAGPGSGSQVATLAASGVAAATYGDATHVPQITVDAKGRATGITNVVITVPSGISLWYTGSGNPQGVLAAALGSRYIDTVTGYAYAKLGGASTIYGWYYTGDTLTLGGYGPTISGWRQLLDGSVANVAGNSIGTQVWGGSATTRAGEFIGNIPYLKFNTAATTGTEAAAVGTTTGRDLAIWGTDFDCVMRLAIPTTITNLRWLCGLTTSNPSNTSPNGSTAATADSYIKFRYDTSNSDTGWFGVCKNGANNITTTAVLNSISAGSPTVTVLRMRKVSGTVYFSVNDGTEVTVATNVPSTGQPFFYVGAWALTNNAVSLYINSIRITQGVL